MNEIRRDQTDSECSCKHGLSYTFWVAGGLRVVSGSAAFVAVMQSTDLTQRDDWPCFGRLNRSRLG